MVIQILKLEILSAFFFLLWTAAAAQKPVLVVRSGHSKPIVSIAFSPDGNTVASASGDKTVRLWNAKTGDELRKFLGFHGGLNSIAFSPDGKTVISGESASGLDAQGFIKSLDIFTGQETVLIEEKGLYIRSVAFNSNGRTIAFSQNIGQVRLWDITTRKELLVLTGHKSFVNSVAFSADGRILASAGIDQIINLWDVETGKKLKTLKGHSAPVHTVAFSADGKTLASGGQDSEIKLWDVGSGKNVHTLKGRSNIIESVAFSRDGKVLASTGMIETILWDIKSGTQLRTLGFSGGNAIAFGPSTGQIALGSFERMSFWDADLGKELHVSTKRKHKNEIFSVGFDETNNVLVNTGWYDTSKLWNAKTGIGPSPLKTNIISQETAAFSVDGKLLATAVSDTSNRLIKVWDTETGRELYSLAGHSETIKSIAISGDRKILASGGSDKVIKLWDLVTGKEIRTLPGHPWGTEMVAISPDGKTLASVGDRKYSKDIDDLLSSKDKESKTVKLWDIETGKERKILDAYRAICSLTFSPDGGYIFVGTLTSWIQINVETGELLLEGYHRGIVNSTAFSSDGKLFASASDDKTIKVWDVAGWKLLHQLEGHADGVTCIAFSPNGEYIISGSSDNTTKVWDVVEGKELLTLAAIDDLDWLVTSPEGLFDGNASAWRRLIWRFDNNTFEYAPVEAFFKEFYRPGLLDEIMSGKTPAAPKTDLVSIDIRQPDVKIVAVDHQKITVGSPGQSARMTAAIAKRDVEITLEVADNDKKGRRPEHGRSSGAQDLRLFRGGSLVKHWAGDVFGKGAGCAVTQATESAPATAICKANVAITAGDNELSAYAFNSQDVKSNDSVATIQGAESLKRKGKLHILAVGVNEYANKDHNLKYAVPDAVDFGAELRKRQIELNNYDAPDVIQLTNAQATKKNILQVLERFAKGGKVAGSAEPIDELTKRLASIEKVEPEDAVVIYFAGHGTAAKDRFYLIPHDGFPAASLTDQGRVSYLHDHSISDLELETLLRDVDAGQMIMVIDACNSGQALEAEEKRRGPMNSKGLAQLAYEKGMLILTASQSYQAALEVTKTPTGKTIEHGLLTYSLLEGLATPAADGDADKQLIDREWLNYAVQQVPQMQLEAMRSRDADVKKGTRDIGINFANEEGADIPPEKRSLQTPRVFYRRESSAKPFIIASSN